LSEHKFLASFTGFVEGRGIRLYPARFSQMQEIVKDYFCDDRQEHHP